MIGISKRLINDTNLGEFYVTDDLILLGNNKFAVPYPKNSDTILSQAGNGSWETRPRDAVGTNETATVDGNTISFNIPEGLFVYALVKGL